MTKINHSATLSLGGAVASSWGSSVGAIRSGADKIKKDIAGLKKEQRGVTASLKESEVAAERFGIEGSAAVTKLTVEQRRTKAAAVDVQNEIRKEQRALSKLGQEGSKKLDDLRRASRELERAENDVAKRLDEARRAAGKLGVDGSRDVAKLRAEHERLDKVLEREGRRLRNADAWQKLGVGGKVGGALAGTARNIGNALGYVGRQAAYATAGLAAAGLAAAGWFAKSSFGAAIEMEQLETSLITVTGSSAKAQDATRWISKFAADTPYELKDVSEAFIRLRAYGIDPTSGMLKTLGDTASSLGKPVMSAVEMMADALTGENERLKEFGIRATKAGDKITYLYKNAAGEDVKKTVKKNSQSMIADTLQAIFNEKYTGAMTRQSRTFGGMVSNLKDQWTQFQVRVMKTGVFDLVKDAAQSALDKINGWAESGKLQQWAEDIGQKMSWAFWKVKEGFAWVQANWPQIKQGFLEFWDTSKKVAGTLYDVGRWLVNAAGGAENLGKGLALLGAAKVLSPLSGLISAGYGVVGWLLTATGLSARLKANLGKVGGAIGAGAGTAANAAGGAASGAGGWLAGAAGGLYGAMSTTAAGFTAATAGTVAAGAALGYGAGTLIDKGTEWATGQSLSDRAANGIGSLVGGEQWRQRQEILSRSGAAQAAPPVQHIDNRKINLRFESNTTDPKEAAREAVRLMNDDAYMTRAASHG